MKLFQCQACNNVLYFENRTCGQCGHRLAYLPEAATLSALEPNGDGWRPLANPDRPGRFCANAEHDACNWLVPADSTSPFCLACCHNGIIPNVSDPQQLQAGATSRSPSTGSYTRSCAGTCRSGPAWRTRCMA